MTAGEGAPRDAPAPAPTLRPGWLAGGTARALPPGAPFAYALTWLSYATYYLGRKGVSVAREPISAALGRDVLRGVDTAYLAAYAAGQWLSGYAGDRVGARRLVGAGMLVSAAACAAFGASTSALAFLVLFALNGLAQSTGWPGNVKAMAEWTTPETRGTVMGLWATCYQIGGIAATAVATRALEAYGWRAAFWAPAIAIATVGVLVVVFLRRGPNVRADERPDLRELEATRAARRAVLRSPVIWAYGAAYFNIKLIRYSLFFWLPSYLERHLGYSTGRAGYLSTAFEIGGVVGTIGIGFLSDRFRGLSRAAYSAISLVLLSGALVLYARFGATSAGINFALMAVVGALLFAPDSLLSGAAAQDAGGPRAAALAAGIVNGIGSAGAIAQETVTRGVSEAYGWDALFNVFVGLAIVASACLLPVLVRGASRARMSNLGPM